LKLMALAILGEVVDLGIVGKDAGVPAWYILPAGDRVDCVGEAECSQNAPSAVFGSGLFAAVGLVDCLFYQDAALSPVVARVSLTGRVFEWAHALGRHYGIAGSSRYGAAERTCLWVHDASDLLLSFAYRCLRLLVFPHRCNLGVRVFSPEPAHHVAVSLLRLRCSMESVGGTVPAADLSAVGADAGWGWLGAAPIEVARGAVLACSSSASFQDVSRVEDWLENKLFDRGCPK
jgi:hypothetical protein